MNAAGTMKISVVIATYNRTALLRRLLGQFRVQSLAASEFEVIVIDDGSADDVAAHVASQSLPYRLSIHRCPNGGAAAARHRGIGYAQAPVIVIVDDDVQVQPDFLARHLDMHPSGSRTVVLGRIRPDPDVPLPLFERFHADILERFATAARTGQLELQGTHLATGNVSFRRDDYYAVGGFDPTLKHSEDAELGIRLKKHGATLRFSDAAYVLHSSDHLSLAKWMRRAFIYGTCDLQIARKHSELSSVDPWRYLWIVNPVSRPLLLASVLAPGPMYAVGRVAMTAALAIDHLRARRLAILATTLVYGIQYFRGIRHGSGSLRQAMTDFTRQRRLRSAAEPAAAIANGY